MTGTVHLVGAGPGAVDLLTLRAARLLGEADIVFHDALVSQEILAFASRATLVAVGKRSGRLSTAQHFINKQLLDAAKRYRTVVRLKGGDPMLFGRAHEEIAFLRKNSIKVEIVPGVSAALAASAEMRISLTRRGEARSVAFVTPRVGQGERESRWVAAVLAADTAAIYMAAGEAAAIARALIAAGKPARTPVAIVERASLPDAKVSFTTLAKLHLLETPVAPALIFVGEVYREAAADAAAIGVLRIPSQSA
ncbi:MAG TPA: uroporphyrinogen-III C-methyltransferase [Burkholderiales bacterium]|nr:uroporphyrinogen-III C-methyltransferase [Burkholderiales bacterium]